MIEGTAFERAEFSYQLAFTDDDLHDQHAFEVTELPEWLAIDESGFLSGRPSADDIGEWRFSVRIIDIGQSSDMAILLSMLNLYLTNKPFWVQATTHFTAILKMITSRLAAVMTALCLRVVMTILLFRVRAMSM